MVWNEGDGPNSGVEGLDEINHGFGYHDRCIRARNDDDREENRRESPLIRYIAVPSSEVMATFGSGHQRADHIAVTGLLD